MKSSKRVIYSRVIFVTGIILLTSLSILFVYETYQKNSSSDIVNNTAVVRQSLEKIFSALKERESAFRGYALTMDSSYLIKMDSSKSVHQQLRTLHRLIAGNPTQRVNLERIQKLFNASIYAQDSFYLKFPDANDMKSPRFYEVLKSESARMDSIRSIITNMQSISLAVSRERELDAQTHTVLATMVGVAVSIFSIIIFIVAFYFVDQELKRSRHYLNETRNLNTKIADINVELEEANQSLQQLNSELEEKNFQLEKYAKELSTFTHITSHDMQEPLRKIEFFVSVVEDREKQNLTEEGKKYLEKIKVSVTRMRKLLLSMLDFSLTNTAENNVEDVDLNDVLQQTSAALKIYIKDTNAILESNLLPKVKGVRYQLIQLFENIISNAIKFRRHDVIPEIQITSEIIHTANKTQYGLKANSKYCKIDFKDNGIGFEQQYAERIFEIFQRLTGKNESYGVGIGLAICRKIAENHGGRLIASSQPNIGSVFSLYIPIIYT